MLGPDHYVPLRDLWLIAMISYDRKRRMEVLVVFFPVEFLWSLTCSKGSVPGFIGVSIMVSLCSGLHCTGLKISPFLEI